MRSLVLLLLIFSAIVVYCNDAPRVVLDQGIVEGHSRISFRGKKFLAFEGIPYAKPPVGDLRFAPPEPASKWKNILKANKHYTCAQLLPEMSANVGGLVGTEDCLYVYVYIPGEVVKNDTNMPVIVNIHGGAFMLGSPQMITGPDFIMDNSNIVYVTLNYRLGILGFLSTEDDVVPGNMGLKDQSLALKWIKENIKRFGGNPDSITITGLSAGGCCVHYHYLSPLSRGLFHRGISHSGTALQSWSHTENPLAKAKFVARNVSCVTDTTDKMIACMRSKDYKNIIEGIRGLYVMKYSAPCTPFGPVDEKGGENPFLSENPYKLLKEGKVYDVPWINTNVQDEGSFPVVWFQQFNQTKFAIDNWDNAMSAALDINDTVKPSNKVDTVNKIKNFYYKNKIPKPDDYDTLFKIYDDRFFLIDSELATRTHAAVVKSPVYFYFYKFASRDYLANYMKRPVVGHGQDGRLYFNWYGDSPLNQNEVKMMHLFIKFLTSFATTGIPQIGDVKWDSVNPNEKEMKILEINSPDDIKMKTTVELGPKEFWNSLPIEENDGLYK